MLVFEVAAVYAYHSQMGLQKFERNTCRLFQLGILFLGLNEIEHNLERARQHKGEEQTKSSEIHVALRTVPSVRHACRRRNDDVLELARSDGRFRASVMNGVVCAGRLEFRGDADHALERVCKEDADKDEGYLETIGDFGDDGAL